MEAKIPGNGLDANGQEIILDADADSSITADTDDELHFKAGGNDLLKLTANGLHFPQGGDGIYLGVTSETAANLLDDYEEGTWTPANANVTLSVTSAVYRKIGSIVYVSAYVTYPSNSDGNSAAITGFPFVGGASNVFGYCTGRCANQASQVVIQVNAGETYADIYKEDDTGLSNSAMNGYMIFSGCYVTSA